MSVLRMRVFRSWSRKSHDRIVTTVARALKRGGGLHHWRVLTKLVAAYQTRKATASLDLLLILQYYLVILKH